MLMNNSVSDEQLYIDFLHGNNEALDELLVRYKEGLTWFLYGIVKNLEDAEDLALLIFVMSRVPVSVRTDMEGEYYGTLLQGKDVGMYIIVGLICFILGVIITMITLKYRDKNEVINQNDD